VVVGAGGEGVSIRRAPGTSGERIKVWPEGTIMLPLGEEQQVEGRSWTRVRDPDGSDGWVAAEFLVDQATATSQPTAAPQATRAAPVATKPAGPTAPLPALRPTFTPAPRGAPASTPVPTAPAKPAAPTAAPAPKPAGPAPTPTPR
jgi:hypothetical protein